MTIFYTPYASLEDAWGTNFDKDIKKKKSKKESKSDPLCELYGKRYKKIKKPFHTKDSDMMESDYFNKVHSFNGEKDKNMYSGYRDDDFSRLVDDGRHATNGLILDDNNGKCIDTYSTSKKSKKQRLLQKQVRFEIEPEDEDDLYLQQAIPDEEHEYNNQDFDETVGNTNQHDFDRIYSNVYDETDDEVVEDELNHISEEASHSSSSKSSDKSMSRLIEEEVHNNSYLNALQHKNNNNVHFVDERQYLDLLMYIFSGIILIFMMEQFIQIGIRMKAPLY